MSAVGGILGRLVGALGGPQTAALVVAGGLVVGAVSGGAIAGGAFGGTPASAGGKLAVYPCPNEGPALTTIQAGQKLLVTGKSDDETWLRIHYPLPGRSEAWVQASPLTVKGSLASVPVATCAPEIAAIAPSFGPDASMTAIQNNSPTPAPTPPPTPEPTANDLPSLTGLKSSARTISYDPSAYCPSALKKVTFTVKASDSTGIAGVTLFWRAPGAATYAQAPMSRTGGSAKSGTWQVTLDTAANNITTAGKLAYYTVGTDTAGATGRTPSGSASITVAVCQNTGPTIKTPTSSAGTTLYQLTRSASNCVSATTISATVTDVDGVQSVTLYYRAPGEATYRSRPMSKSGTKWSASIDTTADKITIPTPPTGTLRWYIKATDTKNASSQSKTGSITIRRCDTEATIRYSDTAGSSMCNGRPTSFFYTASDPDGLSASSATFVYTYVLADLKTTKTAKAKMSGTEYNGVWTYSVTIVPDSTWTYRNVTMTYYVQTVDTYGGTSQGGSGKIQQIC